MDVATLADEIRMNGFVILEQVIPKSTIAGILDRFDPLLEAKRASEPTNRLLPTTVTSGGRKTGGWRWRASRPS